MKIYTEVNYIWKDNKLVQTDSKSYEYSGEVTQAHTRKGGPSYARFNIPHTHKSISDLKPKGGTLADTANVISEGAKSGTAALKAGYDKMREDNPDPNLNVQTPLDLYEKGRQALHDAATVAHEFIDRNTDTISNAKDDVAEALFEPVKGKIEDTATSIITTNSPDTTPGPNEEELYSSRRNFNTMQRDGSRASGGDLRREIPVLKTLSGKAKPKSY